MQINAGANQLSRVMTFIGDIPNDILLNFTRDSSQFFDYNFINANTIADNGLNFGIRVLSSTNPEQQIGIYTLTTFVTVILKTIEGITIYGCLCILSIIFFIRF